MKEFRAWDDDEKCMYYSERYSDLGEYTPMAGFWQLVNKNGFTVEQYTGKSDGDLNKLFENDIVTARFENYDITGHIIYGNCSYWIHVEEGDFDIWLGSKKINMIKLIGNIHTGG